ncbi:hypothetical protein [Burkholderia cepacia]|uniref:hypothetical protein n=1 Tax=Burkholderia cepacia TaxID=292 RepID=UPI001E3EAAC5|nr:hypothetical protein [Burkholderia cepacia]
MTRYDGATHMGNPYDPDPEYTTMKLGLNESLARLDEAGTLFTTLFRHGTLDVELYRRASRTSRSRIRATRST